MSNETTDLIGEQMAECWARAVRALRRGDRVTAEIEWSDALSWAKRVSGPGPYELCWRVMILYQRASNLELLQRLEDAEDEEASRETTARALWLELVDTATLIDREARAVFAELHTFDISHAVGVARRELFASSPAGSSLDASPSVGASPMTRPGMGLGPDLPAASGL